jgi:hypothetical protein
MSFQRVISLSSPSPRLTWSRPIRVARLIPALLLLLLLLLLLQWCLHPRLELHFPEEREALAAVITQVAVLITVAVFLVRKPRRLSRRPDCLPLGRARLADILRWASGGRGR